MNEKPEKKLIKTQKDLEKLILLMKKHRVDSLEVEGKKITISRHDVKDPKNPKAPMDDDETLFWSARQ